MRKDREQSLGEVINLMIKQLKLDEGLLATQAKEFWPLVMGKGIANKTDELWVRNKVMYVKLSLPELKQELSYGREKIVQMINDELPSPYLTDLKFI